MGACQPSTAPEQTPATPPPSTVASGAPATPGGPDASDSGAVGPAGDAADTVPTLHIRTVDGADYDLAAHRGKWVVVNYWATWCAPCLKEMPELSALDAMREHIEVVGLAYEDIEPAAMKVFLLKHPVVYPIAIIDTYSPPADFDTPRGLPMTYLISPDGRIARKILGPVTASEIEQAIAAAGGPAPADGAQAGNQTARSGIAKPA